MQFNQFLDVGRSSAPATLRVAAEHAQAAARGVNENAVETPLLKEFRFFSEIPTARLDLLTTDSLGALLNQFDSLRVFIQSCNARLIAGQGRNMGGFTAGRGAGIEDFIAGLRIK